MSGFSFESSFIKRSWEKSRLLRTATALGATALITVMTAYPLHAREQHSREKAKQIASLEDDIVADGFRPLDSGAAFNYVQVLDGHNPPYVQFSYLTTADSEPACKFDGVTAKIKLDDNEVVGVFDYEVPTPSNPNVSRVVQDASQLSC